MKKLRVLDLFSGIGGFSLGLERAGGFETVAFCEIEDYPRRVLAKHWPDVPCYDDVRTLTADRLAADGIAVDVICGGFPCQDVSFAGKRAGLEGLRSGLWREYARLIGELRPRFVIVENVPGLLSLGMGAVLGDLSEIGYDATWDCIPAAAVGAPHRRDRVWIIAHANGAGLRLQSIGELGGCGQTVTQSDCTALAHAAGARLSQGRPSTSGAIRYEARRAEPDRRGDAVADADELSRHQRRAHNAPEIPRGRDADRSGIGANELCNANVSGLALPERQSRDVGEEFASSFGADWWVAEPDVGRVAHGVFSRVDRLRCLGNAVVPQIPEIIGRAIMQAEGMSP